MVSTKKSFHPVGENTKGNQTFVLMNILNYKLTPTNELLTARTGLLASAHLMQSLTLDKAH